MIDTLKIALLCLVVSVGSAMAQTIPTGEGVTTREDSAKQVAAVLLEKLKNLARPS